MNKTIVNDVCLYIGLSSDPKPVDCDDNALFYELDTGYLYNCSITTLTKYNVKMGRWFMCERKERALREVDYGEDVII